MLLSLLPDPLFSLDWVSGMDKVQHWIAYATLGAVVFLAIRTPGSKRLLFFVVSVFSCTLYGGLIEILQSFTGRTPDVVDFFVNMFGAAVGSVVALGSVETSLDRRRRRTRKGNEQRRGSVASNPDRRGQPL